MPDQLRTFLAVDLSPECIEYVLSLQSQLRRTNPTIKWVRPENFHITLKFLGETPVESISPIVETLRDRIESLGSFFLHTSNIDAFPSLQLPKILWLGIATPYKKLQLVFNTMEESLAHLGFTKEIRPFTPHITLAKTGSLISWDLLKDIETKPVAIHVTHVTFYQSILSIQQPQYVLYCSPLTKRGV